jgi:hypothetical protein
MDRIDHKESSPSREALIAKSNNPGKFLGRILSSSLLAAIISLMGGLAYILQSWNDIHIQTSFVDEGGYLYLGSLFARGILRPFQDFGPRSIYAPLSLLIPGYVQVWFGPGLLTGRLFSLFLGILILVGLWLVARRLSGKWGAALAICAVALTPAQIMVYSSAISEVLVACMLVWVLVFILGEKRTSIQIIIGSILAGMIVMTRQNMIPIVPILIGYVFWQHGKKAGLLCIGMTLAPIIILHAIYWPNILILWARWLPSRLTPFLDRFRPIGEAAWAGIRVSFLARLNALFQGVLFNCIPVLGALITLLAWPGKSDWKNQAVRRASIFLAVLFWVLFLVHAYVTILDNSNDPCTYCLTPYISFFSIAGLLLVCSSFILWRKNFSRFSQGCIIFFILILSTGLGYARFDRFGAWLLNIRLPAIQRGINPQTWLPGFSIAEFLANKYNAEFWSARVYISALAGLIAGFLLISLAIIIGHRVSRNRYPGKYSFGNILLLIVLASGIITSPFTQGDYRDKGVCSPDMPGVYEKIGAALNNLIPPGSHVFWDVTNAVPLLYTRNIMVYPAQIYGGSSYRNGSDNQELLRLGYWNNSLRSDWVEKADFLVIEPNQLPSFSTPPLKINQSRYEVLAIPPLNPCDPNSVLLVYKRK